MPIISSKWDLQPVRDAEVNMKNTLGSSVCVTLFGESHGKCVGAVLDGRYKIENSLHVSVSLDLSHDCITVLKYVDSIREYCSDIIRSSS